MMLKLTGLLSLVVLLGGCASMIENPAQRAPVEEIGSPAPATPTEIAPPAPQAPPQTLRREPLAPPAPPVLGPPEPAATPAPQTAPATPTQSLLAAVDAAMASGDLERAAALCERALRIAPRDGQLWLKLGTIRQRQGRTDDARGFAQRALSLAAGDAQLERQSRVLLELLELDETAE
ncbi:MAG: tetratricopeptide repeat protein [Pseudohongiellaceae bacterium]|jgi:tetratricopeptide (TPR) repeat protein